MGGIVKKQKNENQEIIISWEKMWLTNYRMNYM